MENKDMFSKLKQDEEERLKEEQRKLLCEFNELKEEKRRIEAESHLMKGRKQCEILNANASLIDSDMLSSSGQLNVEAPS